MALRRDFCGHPPVTILRDDRHEAGQLNRESASSPPASYVNAPSMAQHRPITTPNTRDTPVECDMMPRPDAARVVPQLTCRGCEDHE
jgi:hypothetical protein